MQSRQTSKVKNIEWGIINRWDSLTLRSVIEKNVEKSMLDCLDLLIDELRDLQHGLDAELQTDRFMHNKLVLACRSIEACKYACYKPAHSTAGLINDLRSSIATQNDHATTTESGAYFTDRRYHRSRYNRPTGTSSQKMLTDRADHPTDRSTTTPFDRWKKDYKRFVCGKEAKHTRDERHESMLRLRDRINWRVNDEFERQASQYLTEYEGHWPDDHEGNEPWGEFIVDVKSAPSGDPNAEIFMTEYGPLAESAAKSMITDLINRAMSHTLGINNPIAAPTVPTTDSAPTSNNVAGVSFSFSFSYEFISCPGYNISN